MISIDDVKTELAKDGVQEVLKNSLQELSDSELKILQTGTEAQQRAILKTLSTSLLNQLLMPEAPPGAASLVKRDKNYPTGITTNAETGEQNIQYLPQSSTKAGQIIISKHDLNASSKSKIQSNIIEGRELLANLQRLKEIADSPEGREALTYKRAIIATVQNFLHEISGTPLSPQNKKLVDARSSIETFSNKIVSDYIKSMPRPDASDEKAVRLMETVPNISDSPVEFDAKWELFYESVAAYVLANEQLL